MSIVNVNDDSFSGDGSLDLDECLAQTRAHIEAGADIIDVGAESARTNREAIDLAEEIRRFEGFFEAWPELWKSMEPRDAEQVWPPILSANTWRPEVAEACLGAGAEVLNDMGGLHSPENAELCARYGASLLIMHNPGQVKVAATDQHYDDIMVELKGFFSDRVQRATAAGLSKQHLILDPGIDFAKQKDANLTLIARLGELSREFPHPWLLPVSRKTVIGEVLDQLDPRDRDPGTIALITAGMQGGASIFRVHNTLAAWSSIKVLHALETSEK